jgi:cysteine desulfurase
VPRVATTTCVVFPGLPAETVVQALDLHGVFVSAGAACASGSVEASPVLRAMGDPDPASAVRISFGPSTDDAQVDRLLAVLPDVLERTRRAGA